MRLKYRIERIYNFIVWDIPRVIKNFWTFKKVVADFRDWDYAYCLKMFRASLQQLCNRIEFHGYETDESRLKKVEKMKRAIYLMDRILNDNYEIDSYAEAEQRLGIKYHKRPFSMIKQEDGNFLLENNLTEEQNADNMKIYAEGYKIEDEDWGELMDILKGKISFYNQITDPEIKDKSYEEIHDGTGMRSWWD